MASSQAGPFGVPGAARARGAAKAAVESILSSSVLFRWSRALRAHGQLVLAYHNVVDGEDVPVSGDTSLHLPLARFRAQLDALSQLSFNVCALRELNEGIGSDPRLAITFDDACAGALSLAIPELATRGIPATIFVAPGLLGNASPWWDRLSDPTEGGLDPLTRQRALSEFCGRHEPILKASARLGWSVAPPDPTFRIGSAEEIDEALRIHPGLSLGTHSWSHPNLERLTGPELADELRTPLDWMRARWPTRTIPWLAYPYGLESPAVRRAAAAAGYEGAVLVRGGWHRRGADPFGIPRYNVTSGLSPGGFRARLSGLLG